MSDFKKGIVCGILLSVMVAGAVEFFRLTGGFVLHEDLIELRKELKEIEFKMYKHHNNYDLHGIW